MASNPNGSALGPSDLSDINSRLADLDTADAEITKAINAGIDVGDRREQTRKLREQLLKIKQSYFPGQ